MDGRPPLPTDWTPALGVLVGSLGDGELELLYYRVG